MSNQPIAWGMPRPDGLILDVICPEEHDREPGQYTVPLYAQPKAEQEPDEVKQIAEALRQVGLTLIRTGTGFRVADLGRVEAQTAPQPKAEHAEPVAWMWKDGTVTSDPDRADGTWTPLYTAPQPRKRLTDDEIALIVAECAASAHRRDDFSFARAIEAAVWGETK